MASKAWARAVLVAVHLAVAALVASAMPRHLTPAARDLLQRAEATVWRRELEAASAAVAWRRRRRRLLGRPIMQDGASSPARHLQKYNDYLPDDADVSLVELASATTTQCLSPLQKFFVEMIESIGLDTWEEIEAHNITSLAYLYKHHVSGTDGANEYFGTYGERSAEMKGNHAALREFWSSAEGGGEGSGNVVLLGMHGVDLADDDKLVPTLQQMYGLDGGEAFALGRKIQALVESLPGAFNNPVLTTNAIAIQSLNPDGSARERDSIIIGDGVFAFLEWLELRSNGPAYIHAHEFGHHLQYDVGIKAVGNGWTKAEETRRWEMMADVYGSYFLSHAAGGRMDARDLLEVHRAAFSMGDCEGAIGSHHGTPRQRECASNYGANLALASWRDGGRIVPASHLQRRFDEDYAKILALDAEQCETVLSTNLLDEAIYGETSGASTGGSGNVAIVSQDLETPWKDAPSFGGHAPQSEYKPFDAAPQSGWEYGAPFEVYDPEAHAQPANELDEPPPRVQNGAYVGGEATSDAKNRTCIGWAAFAAAVLASLLHC